MSISLLRAARKLISGPNSWTTGILRRESAEGNSYCALGAVIFSNSNIIGDSSASIETLASVLRKRFAQEGLPRATHGSGGEQVYPWEKLVHSYEANQLVAQFNNSTSQKEVLKLFDEAIASVDGGQPAEPSPAKEPKPEPVKVPEKVLEFA